MDDDVSPHLLNLVVAEVRQQVLETVLRGRYLRARPKPEHPAGRTTFEGVVQDVRVGADGARIWVDLIDGTHHALTGEGYGLADWDLHVTAALFEWLRPQPLSREAAEYIRVRLLDSSSSGQVSILPPAPAVSSADLDTLLAVARLYVDAFRPDEMMTLLERLTLQQVEDVLARLDAR